MRMNNNIKILINIAAFIVCAAAGFVLAGAIRNNSGASRSSSDSSVVSVVGGSGAGTGKKTAKEEKSGKKGNNTDVRIIADGGSGTAAGTGESAGASSGVSGMTADVVNTASRLEEAAAASEPVHPSEIKGTVPEISGSRRAAPKSSTEVNKLGYAFYTAATVASDDNLTYLLYKKGDSTPAYTSKNGRFDDVYPVEGGSYRLVVKNDRTGDSAEADVTGFDMVQKWSKDKLEEQLNSMDREKMFFFHFDNSKLKFECLGLDDAPATLNALLADKAAMGWTVKVVDTPVFDSYNRITFFRIQIISE